MSAPSDSMRTVITGIGLWTALGRGREETWSAVKAGRCGVRPIEGVPGIPTGMVPAAMVDVPSEVNPGGHLKCAPLCVVAAEEAFQDACLRTSDVDPTRIGCCVGGHMGGTDYVPQSLGHPELSMSPGDVWSSEWFPHVANSHVVRQLGLGGPASIHSTACAGSTIDLLTAHRFIQDGRCDVVLTGGAEFIHPIFAAGFQKMRALGSHSDPMQACRPFDQSRNGFVMGEGAGILVLERLSHAKSRGAPVYAEILGGHMLADAQHITGLDADTDSLEQLIGMVLRKTSRQGADIAYINAHGTGTQQNDVMECQGVRRALGPAADSIAISSVKPMIGHLVNASGAVEIALTALALRDGFMPPTINLADQDPLCDLDCIPQKGRSFDGTHALKLSIAFGGHLAAVMLGRV